MAAASAGPRAPSPTSSSGLRARREVSRAATDPLARAARSSNSKKASSNSMVIVDPATPPGQSTCTGPGRPMRAAWRAGTRSLQDLSSVQAAGPLRDRRHQRRMIDSLMIERRGLAVGEDHDRRALQEGARHTVDDRRRAGPERGQAGARSYPSPPPARARRSRRRSLSTSARRATRPCRPLRSDRGCRRRPARRTAS